MNRDRCRYLPTSVRPAWMRTGRITDDCVEWPGGYDLQGYPREKVDGRSHYAHRRAFEWLHGRIPAGAKVYRVCGNRRCVYPLHLTLQPPELRSKRPRVPGTAKLTARKVRAIRARWASPERPTQAALARRFGVSRSAISLVVRGRTWAWV